MLTRERIDVRQCRFCQAFGQMRSAGVGSVLSLAACSGSSPGADSGTGTTTSVVSMESDSGSAESGSGSPEILVHESTFRYCERFFECGCSILDSAWYSSVEECVALEEPQTLGVLESGRAAGLTFDSDCFESRAGRHLSLGCDTDWKNAGPRIVCNLHFGSVELGDSCVRHDSAEGDDCDRGLFCWSGKCVEREMEYAIGEECYLQHPYCEYGGICMDLDDDGGRVCELLPSSGQPCLLGLCAPGLICIDNATCSPAPALGDPCGARAAECAPCLECDLGLNPPSCGQGLSGPGEPCASDRNCVAGAWCRDAGTCSADPVVCWSGSDSVPISTSEYALCRNL